jgi:hypothetical protein
MKNAKFKMQNSKCKIQKECHSERSEESRRLSGEGDASLRSA